MRRDSIYLIDEFNKDYVIVKYRDEDIPKRILNNGSERLLGINAYDGDFNNKAYVYNNSAFCFVEQKRYKVVSDKTQLRKGMIVEFFNNDKWTERKVDNVDIEYERMYKLLIKYQKLRVCID